MPDSLADQTLSALVRRRGLRLPASENRVDRRGFWQFLEVRERWGGADPNKYEEIRDWFRGRNDKSGTPRGGQVWLDLCRWCGQDPKPYDSIPASDPVKLTVEHWFSQCMSGDWPVLRNGLMGLYAVEWGFNNTAEFKTIDSLAEVAFLGQRSHRNHCAFIGWLHTKKNHQLPSLAFLQSTHCVDTDLATPIYLSSGMRATGRTRQLYLPFGAAQGLRSGLKRARVEEEGEATAAPAKVPCDEWDIELTGLDMVKGDVIRLVWRGRRLRCAFRKLASCRKHPMRSRAKQRGDAAQGSNAHPLWAQAARRRVCKRQLYTKIASFELRGESEEAAYARAAFGSKDSADNSDADACDAYSSEAAAYARAAFGVE